MSHFLQSLFKFNGPNPDVIMFLSGLATIAVLLIIALLAYYVLKSALLLLAQRWNLHIKSRWIEIFLRHRLHLKVAHILPAIILFRGSQAVLEDLPVAAEILHISAFLYFIFIALLIIGVFLDALVDIYQSFECARQVPIKGFVQLTKIVVYFIALILIVAKLLDKSPLYLLSGLGALTAVLMLIFRDAILGFVAGIQLSANRMVAQGDWISMPQYGADGDVLEVALTTVKVQNWDKTVTTIPTYALISESFVNWRGMQESGGRRIMRSINIDISSIKFCTEEMLKRFGRIQYIREYLEQKEKEIAEYNRIRQVDQSSFVNGRRLTNVGTFRAYINAYLKNHPMIHENLTFLIRHLQPTQNGLPIEIYVFCNDPTWAVYENVQADIFDHILAVVPEFDLKIFQSPSGSDVKQLLEMTQQ